MNAKKILGLSLVVAFAATIAGVALTQRKPEQTVALAQSPSATTLTPPVSESTPPVKNPTAGNRPPIQPVPVAVQPVTKSQKTAAQAASAPTANNSIQDPMARVALSFVGADPEAEQYWAAAINDPALSADERQNLIEDLNEDGLSDPKHPGPEDLPLIWNRMRLIEELAPYAMDQVNWDAFAEAYKDLNNLLAGGPVP